MFATGSTQSPERDATSSSPNGDKAGKQKQNNAGSTSQQRIRRRNRLITSCLECRRRKLKCDKLQPCTNCTRFKRDCLFLAPALDHESQQKLAEIKEKMGTLEKTLEEDIARKKRASGSEPSPGSRLPGQHEDSEDDVTPPEDEKDLEVTTIALESVAYDNEPDEDLVDLGIQVGKMRITDRDRYEEMVDIFKGIPGIEVNDIQPLSRGDLLGPSSEYVAPASSFFFAPPVRKIQTGQSQATQVPLVQYLPSRGMADRLMAQYWHAVHPVCKVVHRPSFERHYEVLWRDMSMGLDYRNSFMALVFSALFSAAISMPEHDVYETYAVEKKKLVDNFREGTELALSQARFLRTTKLETLQAFVAYLIPLCRSEISRSHAALTGTAIRLAECMGLHKDGVNFGLPALETHIRRIVWYQLCSLDLRTCEACGPRPRIRMDDFDTRMPLNVDDIEFEGNHPPTQDSNSFTDTTIVRIRFECNEIHRLFWFERTKIGKGKVTVTSLLSKGERFRAAMEKNYYPMLDLNVPLHFHALQLYKVLALRLHSMLLHRYASNSVRIMPDRLRNIMMSSCTLVLEHAITMEANPAIKAWAWYSGAINQWHVALLVMGELYAKPPPKPEEERIWRCLDYALELPHDLTPAEKGRIVLSDLRGKTEAYRRLHRLSMTKMPDATSTDLAKKLEERPRQSSSSTHSGATPPPIRNSTYSVQPNIMSIASNAARSPDSSRILGIREATGAIPTAEFQASTLPGGPGDNYYAPPILQQAGIGSPPSSNSSLNFGQNPLAGGSPGGDLMTDIDWNEWDRLFPPQNSADPNNLYIPPFSFPESMGGPTGWQNPTSGV